MEAGMERAAIVDAYRAVQALAPLVQRMAEMEEEEARISRLLEQFARVVERRLLCLRCGAPLPAATSHCVGCGTPLRRRRAPRQSPPNQP
jgi:ribosomal protein L40E